MPLADKSDIEMRQYYGQLVIHGIVHEDMSVEQALSILRGQTGSTSLYDPNGGTAGPLGQRELGKV